MKDQFDVWRFNLGDCSILWAVRSDLLFGKRGRVTLERRNAIRATMRDFFRLSATD
jgi:hypothetical protein